jgi:hypothetical protein
MAINVLGYNQLRKRGEVFERNAFLENFGMAGVIEQCHSDLNIKRLVRMKRLSNSLDSNSERVAGARMFDQFFMFGAEPHPVKAEVKPVLLAMYPSTGNNRSEGELEQVKMFCFPNGFEEIKVKRRILTRFVFYLTQGYERVYGICVQFSCPIGFSSNWSRKFPFAMCFLSQYPYIESHFQFATYLVRVLCGKVSRESSHLDSWTAGSRIPLPISGFCHKSLTLDASFPAIAVFKGLRASKLFFDELLFYHHLSTKIDDGVGCISFFLTKDMPLSLPVRFSESPCLAFAGLHTLFSALGPRTVVALFTAMLLEQRILFFSSDPQKASLSVIGATSLLHPFKTNASIMPLIPEHEKFQQLLDSPVPYIFGCTKKSDRADVTVNLDLGEITAVALPELPRGEDLVRKIRAFMADFADLIVVPEKCLKSFFGAEYPNPVYDKFLEAADSLVFVKKGEKMTTLKYIFTPYSIEVLLTLFASHVAVEIEERARSCFVTDATESDPVTVLNGELMFELFPAEEKPFWAQFMATHIFDGFCARLIKEGSVSKLLNDVLFRES